MLEPNSRDAQRDSTVRIEHLEALSGDLPSTFESAAFHRAQSLDGQTPSCDRLKYISDLNVFLSDPSYRVVFFARHAHAEQGGKKVDGQDKFRELDEQGKADAAHLGRVLSELKFDNVIMVASSATRTHETAKAIANAIETKSTSIVAEDRFFHTPVKEYFKFLRESEDLQDTRHAFIVGHNSAMTKVFLKISGQEKAFIPTAGVLALAIKADSWENFYKNQHDEVHVFTWSPRGTEMLECVRATYESEYSAARYGSASLEFLA
jgi:phosphohistidine phosphatase SixA